jgi:hypothetical protein
VLICTDTGLSKFSGGQLAYFAKCTIEGFAQGSVPCAQHWRLPPLYQSGIRYAEEPNHGKGLEDFALPFKVFERRWGDCDDLCIYRIWELRVAGVPATCNAIWIGDRVHVRVRLPDGNLEDPSIILGATPK